MSQCTTRINDLRQFIEYCPPPGPVAEGLYGWRVADGNVCAKCASRLIGRGFGSRLRYAEPVWEPSTDMCSLCFQIMKDYPT